MSQEFELGLWDFLVPFGSEKQLVYYELDLGLNHVVRKWADAVDPSANLLVAVPGVNDGPGGVVVCSENFVVKGFYIESAGSSQWS